ncbi:efflux RND transporter periplasmic adaptor subunit [Marinobacter orientalis]|uniref:Efflux transporter periplasmic adaptor subunit n=1 Tax=Marinobacter orientalis TaxID=1928859 RepID=A0A7Y0NJB6_9GAMM|nr:efflux transporter periplasmic adaptor subunit [Marinobacter orientalis]NMT62059.1 efflux transporter periplasmic adaptor subunit [Marinobacter orientalis]TGX50784.1 efflux transporter periplasmic adaptor subunit [Marinobacter orientalis]
MHRKHKFIVALTLIAGIAFVVIMAKMKQPPERTAEQPSATPATILEVTPLTVRTEARGYGQVLPARSWQAVANVGGRIIWKHPDLESGNMISEGTRLLQIDPTRYELAEASARADIAALEAELRQLDQEKRNTRELLELENRRLALAQRELERAKTLVDRGALSETRLDEQQRATLHQQQAVQSLKNQLNLIPVRRDTLKARLARSESALANALEDLEDTRFGAPWDMRVHRSEIETGQQVSPNQTLLVADDITAAEATVQLQMSELRNVLSQIPGAPDPADNDETHRGFTDFHRQLPLDSLTVSVQPTSAPDSHWRGKLTRITGSLDPATRTIQAVITVEEPYRDANPPARPPLVRNMFVQATIAVPTPEPVLVVPASAIHQGEVYLADDNDRLQRQPVTLAWQQGELAVVSDGLEAGDRLILDDLVPAIEGTLLNPRPDEQTRQWLQKKAAGEQP